MVHVHSLVTLLSLSPIRMRNSWRECQGLASSGPPRERRSNNTATASSSGRGKKTHTHTHTHTHTPSPLSLFPPNPLLSCSFSPSTSLLSHLSLFLYFPLLSLLLLFLPSSSSSPFPSSLPSLFLHLLLVHIIYTVLGFRALSQCPWTSKTFVCSMRSHTGSAGRLTAQGRSVSVSITV